MKAEKEILESVLWPIQKTNLVGNLSYSNTIDFKEIVNVSVSRTNESIEIFYSSNPISNIADKTYFVKLYLSKINGEYDINYKKSSPEIKNEEDLKDVLNIVKNAIIKMNVNPTFFPTGIVSTPKNKLNIV